MKRQKLEKLKRSVEEEKQNIEKDKVTEALPVAKADIKKEQMDKVQRNPVDKTDNASVTQGKSPNDPTKSAQPEELPAVQANPSRPEDPKSHKDSKSHKDPKSHKDSVKPIITKPKPVEQKVEPAPQKEPEQKKEKKGKKRGRNKKNNIMVIPEYVSWSSDGKTKKTAPNDKARLIIIYRGIF